MKHYERYRWDGQVTVFALMIFMVVLSVLISQYRSALFYACYTDANTDARLSADAFLAAYHRELRNCYGILAVDAGCGQKTFNSQKIEQKLLQDFKRNIEGSLIRTQVELVNFTESPIYTCLIDGDWEFFIRELNLKGYITTWSCAGHPNSDKLFGIYIVFKENYDFDYAEENRSFNAAYPEYEKQLKEITNTIIPTSEYLGWTLPMDYQ